jgi:hypothetical protein
VFRRTPPAEPSHVQVPQAGPLGPVPRSMQSQGEGENARVEVPSVVSDQQGDPVAAVVHTPEGELSDAEWNRRWLKECSTDLDSANLENAEQRVEHALVTSIATIMDAAGTARKRTVGEKLDLKSMTQPGFQFFIQNANYYNFRVGEFPDFDDLMTFRAQHAQWLNSRPRASDGPAAETKWRGMEPQFPMDLVSRARTRTEEALSLAR